MLSADLGPAEAFTGLPRRASRSSEEGGNALLDRLDGESFAALYPDLTPVTLTRGQRLTQSEMTWFPLSARIAVSWTLTDGPVIDTFLVGSEGAFSAPASTDASARVTVRRAGEAYRVCSRRLAELRRILPDLAVTMDAEAARQLYEAQRTAACIAAHTLEARMATWLLRCCGERPGTMLPITQEELAEVLGAQRTSVNVGAQALKIQGAIAYLRGRIRITDPERLEARSCACYRTQRA